MSTTIVFSQVRKHMLIIMIALTMFFGATTPAAAQFSSSSNQDIIAILMEIISRLKSQETTQTTQTNTVSPEGGFASSDTLGVGDRVKTTSILRVRSGAGIGSSLVNNVSAFTSGTIEDGPKYADGYTWWQVQYDNGIRGWSAEGWFTRVGSTVSKPMHEDVNEDKVSVEVVSPNGRTYEYGDRMTVKWKQAGSVAKGSEACVSLYSVDQDRYFTFPADGGSCIDIDGEESQRSVTGEIVYSSGYRLEPGKYYINVRLIEPSSQSGKDGSTVASDSDSYIWIEEVKEVVEEKKKAASYVTLYGKDRSTDGDWERYHLDVANGSIVDLYWYISDDAKNCKLTHEGNTISSKQESGGGSAIVTVIGRDGEEYEYEVTCDSDDGTISDEIELEVDIDDVSADKRTVEFEIKIDGTLVDTRTSSVIDDDELQNVFISAECIKHTGDYYTEKSPSKDEGDRLECYYEGELKYVFPIHGKG